jgi:hypothetical protein
MSAPCHSGGWRRIFPNFANDSSWAIFVWTFQGLNWSRYLTSHRKRKCCQIASELPIGADTNCDGIDAAISWSVLNIDLNKHKFDQKCYNSLFQITEYYFLHSDEDHHNCRWRCLWCCSPSGCATRGSEAWIKTVIIITGAPAQKLSSNGRRVSLLMSISWVFVALSSRTQPAGSHSIFEWR